MPIGCKNVRNHSVVASTLPSSAQCFPSGLYFITWVTSLRAMEHGTWSPMVAKYYQADSCSWRTLGSPWGRDVAFLHRTPPMDGKEKYECQNECVCHCEWANLKWCRKQIWQHVYLSNGRRSPRRNAASGMVPYVLEYSGVSKPSFLIPIEHQVKQQCTNTNANIVVRSSKRQPPEHILLPEHFSQVQFPGAQPICLKGRADDKSTQPANMNIHRFQICFLDLCQWDMGMARQNQIGCNLAHLRPRSFLGAPSTAPVQQSWAEGCGQKTSLRWRQGGWKCAWIGVWLRDAANRWISEGKVDQTGGWRMNGWKKECRAGWVTERAAAWMSE